MFWFDRHDERAVFVDCRRGSYELPDISSTGGKRSLVVAPDVMADFTALPFENDTFPLVCFDPPHLTRNGEKSWMGRKYGTLPKEWPPMLEKGFAECFRVLKPLGTLVFKWNEDQIPVSRVLSLTPHRPLFGNRYGKHSKSHWIVFLKPGS